MRTSPTVGKTDTAGIDHQTVSCKPHERHVCMTAHDRPDLGRRPLQNLLPTFQSAVDEDNLLIVARGGMAEQDVAEPRQLQGQLLGHSGQEFEMGRRQLCCTPDGEGIIIEPDVQAVGHLQELTVCVAAEENCTIAKIDEPVQHFSRLRAPGMVARDHYQFGGLYCWFREDLLQSRKHPMDVGEHRDRGSHAPSVPDRSIFSQIRSSEER